jgi:kynurenine formamidase
MIMKLPGYRDLPTHRTAPDRSAWGLFGDDDEIGTINLLTPAHVQKAAAEVRDGKVFSLNWDQELPDPPILGRKAMHHHIIDLKPGADDYYDSFYPQASSQWDALCHMPHPKHGYYNGRTQADITGRPGSRNGIEHWGRRGIVGRFVLADVVRYREAQGRPIRPGAPDPVTVDDLVGTLDRQGARLEEADILLVRMGWVGWYETLNADQRQGLADAGQDMATTGLSGEEDMAEWLWDTHIAAIGCDVPALEVLPSGPWNSPDPEEASKHYLHFRIIPLLGLAVGEMFVLDALADDCAADGRYAGQFTAAPFNKRGGADSTANALAIK